MDHSDRHASRGQATVETILMLPLFMALVFGLLQICQLAVALIVMNYAASSVAQQAVADNAIGHNSGPVDLTQYDSRVQNLLVAGMHLTHVVGESSPQGPILANITIHTCATVTTFPLVAQVLYQTGSVFTSDGTCHDSTPPLGFEFSSRNKLVVHGKSTARMNYQP